MTGHVEPYKRKAGGEWRVVRGKWRCVVDLGRHSGRRSREVFVYTGGKKEAEAELSERMTALRKGISIGPVTGTVGEWLDEWVRSYVEPRAQAGDLALATCSDYKAVVRLYLKPELGDIPLKKLKPEHVTALYAKMTLAKSAGGYGVGPTSRERAHAVLRIALGKAIELHRVRVNVLEKGRGVDRPKVPQREVTALEPEEAAAVLAKLATGEGEAARLFLPAYLALATGMRRGELLALRWDDVKLPKATEPDALGTITVARAWDTGEAVKGAAAVERYRIKTPKNGRVRHVDIGPAVVAMLRAAKKAQAERKLAASQWYAEAKRADGSRLAWGDLVITDAAGFPWWPASFSARWRAWTKHAKVSCRFHDLRATSLSIALAGGADAEAVRQRAGHHSAAFFLERYAKPMRHAREKDAAIMSTLVGAISELPASVAANG